MAKGIKGFQPGNREGTKSRFTMYNQPKNRGRKSRIYTILKKECDINIDQEALKGLSREQIKDVLKLVLLLDPRESYLLSAKMAANIKQVNLAVEKGRSTPQIKASTKIAQLFISLNSSVAKEMSAGKCKTVCWIIEYLYGRSTQPIQSNLTAEITTKPLDLSVLTDEELLQFHSLLDKIERGKNE